MSPETISIAMVTTFVALVVTAVFQYAPKVSLWWAALPINVKKLGIAGVYLFTGAVIAWGGCVEGLKAIIPSLMCVEPATFLEFGWGVILAVAGGQGVFGLAPELKSVTAVKAVRDAAVLAATPAELAKS